MRIRIDYRTVLKTLGQLLTVEALLLLIPLILSLWDHDGKTVGFTIAAASAGLCGTVMRFPVRYHDTVVRRREGYLIVSLAWIVFSLFGMIPFLTGEAPLSVSDAFFETVSGFTTTGATVIADVEQYGRALLLWRAMTQWVGGLGIILFMLALLPWLNDRGGIPMFNAEITGITHDKLHPRIRQTAATLWKVYIVITLLLILALWVGPMDFFDALCQAFATISTGGFSTRNAGIGAWHSDYISLVLTLFMFIGGMSFTLIYSAFKGKWRQLFHNDVFRAYCAIVVVSTVVISLTKLTTEGVHDFESLVVQPLFHVVSAITTTGFSLGDFAAWGPAVLLVTLSLMLCGACAGSTTGAMKVDRILALKRNLAHEIIASISPKRVFTVKINGNLLTQGELKRVMAFVSLYLALILAGVMVVSLSGVGFDDGLFAVVSCIGNNGLGYGLTGAEGGFHSLPDASKWLLSLLMITGRLEVFSVLVLFSTLFWRK